MNQFIPSDQLFYFNKPQIIVKLTTRTGQSIYLKNADFGGDLLSFKFDKSVSLPFGRFSFSLLDKRASQSLDASDSSGQSLNSQDLRKALAAKTLVEVWINDDFICVGTVEKVSRSFSMSGGKPSRTYNVECDELGALFQKTKITDDASVLKHFQLVKEGKKKTSKSSNSTSQKPQITSKNQAGNLRAGIVRLWKQWVEAIYNDTQFQFADGTCLTDRLVVDMPYMSDQLWVEKLNMHLQASSGSDLWGAFQQVLSSPFHECWGTSGASWKNIPLNQSNLLSGDEQTVSDAKDSDMKATLIEDGKYYLILRPTPYDHPDLMVDLEDKLLTAYDLPVIYVDDSMITGKDLAVSGDDMFTMYQFKPEATNAAEGKKHHEHAAAYDYEALQKYGYRSLTKSLKGIKKNKSLKNERAQDAYLSEIVNKLQNRMVDWYKYSDRFLAGSFTCMGNSKAQEGTILNYITDARGMIEDSEEMGIYYIQSFSHSYQFGQSFTTTYNVVRGISDLFVQEVVSAREEKLNTTSTFY